MVIFDNLRNAWRLLRQNKVRSFLTMLGIIIGVMAVVVIMSVGAGAQSLIVNQFKSMGTNLVGVLPGKSDEKGPPASVMGIVVTTLKDDDRKAFDNGEIPHILASTSYVRGIDTVTSGDNKTDTNFLGTSAGYPNVEEINLEFGRYFTEEEEKGNAKVAVIGSTVAKALFPDADPLGKNVKIKKTIFQIIGVAKERGRSGFQDQDNQIFVPLSTAQKLLLGINYVNFMRVKVDSADNISEVEEFIKIKLREQHNITNPDNDDFSVRSTNQGIEAISSVTNGLKFFLAAIAAISLVVGGIGIMNIMLAAVEERTKEIGLRKAVGAKSRQIIAQFLVETILITFTGGVIGIIIGSGISILVASIAKNMGYSWDLVITPSSIILGCIVSIVIGIVFGVTPARHAARLNPIEALRHE
ncbi:MAG: ABC transporter permease [Patescibacteria group bacterium]|jgi:ABC-type antimicrobial peptide transport system permease subunit